MGEERIQVFASDGQFLGWLMQATPICVYLLLSTGDMVYVRREHAAWRGSMLVLDLTARELEQPEYGRLPLDIGFGLPPL